METGSRILIEEAVLPASNVSWSAATNNLVMMSQFNAAERTEATWRAILEGAGLALEKIYTYAPLLYGSIIVAAPLT